MVKKKFHPNVPDFTVMSLNVLFCQKPKDNQFTTMEGEGEEAKFVKLGAFF